jgi:hypothetical protein
VTAVPDVVVKWKTPALVVASVRDGLAGVADVRRTAAGWTCSCGKHSCVHVATVRALTAEAVAR